MPSNGLRRLNPALPLSEIYGLSRTVRNDCLTMLSVPVASQLDFPQFKRRNGMSTLLVDDLIKSLGCYGIR